LYSPGSPTVEIVYTRLPSDVERYSQELLHDGPDCKISLMARGPDSPLLRIGEIEVEPGGAILWFVFAGRPYEVASVYDPAGEHLGYYTNFVQPPALHTDCWRLTDLYLDVWQPAGGTPRLLDEDELDEAVRKGLLEEEAATHIRTEAEAVLRAATIGRWPPVLVRRNDLDSVPALRFRRDAPATFFANLVIGRFIAFGIYAFGAVSLISLAFAALSDALVPGGSPARIGWLAAITVSTALLLILALAGRLPATRRPRVEEAVTERILFIGTLVAGVAVLLYPDSRLWRGALVGVYGVLALFLAVFAASRARYEHRFPALAITGLLVCAAVLLILL
jgi:predicted RNA-binding protein associated with RNAse of E/G family